MKKNWLRTLSLILCLALCFGLFAGCGGPDEEEQGTKEEIVIGTDIELKAADPMGNWSSSCYYIYWACYDRLIGYDYETAEYIPELATSWEVSKDGMEYTFHLRDDVKWHDGTPFTSADVVWSVKRGVETACGCYPGVSHAEAIDEYTVKVIMETPNSVFLDCQWGGDCTIIKDGSGDELATEIMGTGAYKLKEWIIGDHVTLEANPNYWGGEPEVKYITLKAIPEANSRLMALQAGDIDATILPATNIKQAEADENLAVDSVLSSVVYFLGFNQNNEVLSNPLVRQAISHAIDKEALVFAQLEGKGAVRNTIVPPGIQGHHDGLTGYEFDIEKAKALMKEAGYESGVELSLTTSAGRADLAAQVIQQSLREIGITVTINQMEDVAFKEYLFNNNAELFLQYRGLSNADFYLNVVHSDRIAEGRDMFGYSDPEYDAMLEKAATLQGEERNEVYRAMQEKLEREAVLAPLYSSTTFLVHQKELQGIQSFFVNGVDVSGAHY